MRTHLIRGVLSLAVVLAFCAPALAQSVVRGKVVDGQGKPVPDAEVLFEAQGVNRQTRLKTDRNGDFLQVGLSSGEYKVTVSKQGVGSATQTTRVSQGQNQPLNFTISPATAAAASTEMSAEEKAAAAKVQAAAGAAIAAMNTKNYDEAITQWNTVLAIRPTCLECYLNLGTAHSAKQQYSEAEAAFKKAIELKPDSADAYTGLTSIYNAQKKFDLASEAGAKAAELSGGAAGGGSAEATYNQGVIFWNAGKFAEAKTQFEAAVKADPNMAMAHYQLGMANLNLGQVPAAREAFENYLKVDPNGPKAAEVKTFIAQLPK